MLIDKWVVVNKLIDLENEYQFHKPNWDAETLYRKLCEVEIEIGKTPDVGGDLIRLSDLMKFPIRIDHYDKENGNEHFVYGVESVLEYADYLPRVEAEPVVHAHWVGTQYDGYADGYPVYDLWECSECREEYESEGDPPPYDRCPHCGAHMDEEVAR